MRELFAALARVARTDATVLIGGETGTGKELVARAVHEHSARADGPFEVVDCGALAESLAESELFGHERGAFTGAATAHAGAFERARGGTVFLDEIGELPLEMQPRLLRVLEGREIRRVGGSKSVRLDLRIVAATHRDLAEEVRRGRFRQDLYYRLAVAEVRLPALRERPGDIDLLVEHFLARLGCGALPAETMARLRTHDWPGNVRELRNAVERAALQLDQGARPAPSLTLVPDGEPICSDHIDLAVPFRDAKHRLVHDFEQRYLRALLTAHAGNLSAAARTAGIDRMALRKLLARCRVER